MAKKSSRKRNRRSRKRNRRNSRNRRNRRSRRRRNRRRNRQRGGGCIKNEYTATNPTPAGVAFQPGKNNGLGGGYYYGLNQNPSLLGFPQSTVGKMGVPKKGGRRRSRRRRSRRRNRRRGRHRHSKNCRCSRKNVRRNQRGGHSFAHAPSAAFLGGDDSFNPLNFAKKFIPNDVIDVGRNIGTGARNYLHKYEGELGEVGGDVMKQPDLDVIDKPSHVY